MPRKDRTIPKVKAPRTRGVITDSDDLKKNPILNYRKYNQIVNNPSAMYSLHATDRYRLQEFVKNHSIIIPTRVNGKQTSIKIRTSVAALHAMIVGDSVRDYKRFLMDSVYRISQSWYGEDGKGLSGFIQDAMIRECFDSEEKDEFDTIVTILNNECASVALKKDYFPDKSIEEVGDTDEDSSDDYSGDSNEEV